MAHLQNEQKSDAITPENRLLLALAENLKLPLLQIARRAELGQIKPRQAGQAIKDIELTADAALQLLDSYLLSLNLANEIPAALEPVSVPAVLAETAQKLEGLAKRYNCSLELQVKGRYEPVIAHAGGLKSALTSLGMVFIEAQSVLPHKKPATIQLAAHHSRGRIVAGLFADVEGLSADMYRRARTLYGKSRQPLTQMSAGAGAGVFIADSLLSKMATNLRVAHHHKLSGLAATFAPTSQLELI